MGRISKNAMTCGDERTIKHDGCTFCTSTISGTYCTREAAEEGEGEADGAG
jgi:hypothetical protein